MTKDAYKIKPSSRVSDVSDPAVITGNPPDIQATPIELAPETAISPSDVAVKNREMEVL